LRGVEGQGTEEEMNLLASSIAGKLSIQQKDKRGLLVLNSKKWVPFQMPQT
jgi:hypothetical protein